jgi:RNA polymerase sigma-70 factor (ECF subfamily)
MVNAPHTSPTLLGRLRQYPIDQAAWRDFVTIYGGFIYDWARRWGLQAADAEDVTQATLLRLAKAMQDFQYDSTLRFRGWLRTVAYHVWQDLARVQRPIPLDAREKGSPLLTLTARDDLAQAIESAFERELLEQAFARVRLRVQPKTWQAFQLTVLDGLSGQEAASRLGMPLVNIYKSRSNVQKLLNKELAILKGDGRED